MRLLFVVDARSPIVTDWLGHFASRSGVQVHVISTYPAHPEFPNASYAELPVAFAGLVGAGASAERTQASGQTARLRLRGSLASSVFIQARRHLGPLTLPLHSRQFKRIVHELGPDLVHAMRLPMEGFMSASALASHIPLVVSIWGNDLTLNAAHSPVQRHWTRMTLHRANALMADSWRDLRLAPRHGFSKARPMLRVPGNGGIKADVFFHGPADPDLRARLEIPLSAKVVLNPRGVREYVRTEAFFFAIRELRTAREDIWFVATGLKANARYEALAARLGISDRLRMLGTVPRGDMAKLYRLADVMVSPSVHDGTPNCLLEAMACGSFPIVGDIETMHEWIQHERNGLLVDPADPREIASAIVTAVDAEDFRMKAASFNVALVSRDANFGTCMSQVTSFYEELVSAQSGPARQGDRAIGPGPQEPT